MGENEDRSGSPAADRLEIKLGKERIELGEHDRRKAPDSFTGWMESRKGWSSCPPGKHLMGGKPMGNSDQQPLAEPGNPAPDRPIRENHPHEQRQSVLNRLARIEGH